MNSTSGKTPLPNASLLRVSPARDNGFTLIELLAVITVMALLSALVVAQYSSAPKAPIMGQKLASAHAALENARLDALKSGTTITIDRDALPDGFELVDLGEGARPAKALLFYPDGSSSGGVLMLAGKPRLVVEWISGFVHAPA